MSCWLHTALTSINGNAFMLPAAPTRQQGALSRAAVQVSGELRFVCTYWQVAG